MTTLTGRLAVLPIVLCGGVAAAADLSAAEARSIADRFIAAQYAMTPVTGEFVIEGTTVNPLRPKNPDRPLPDGVTAVPEPKDRRLRCRWSIDRRRELLDPLDGTKGVYHRFLQKDAGLVDGPAVDRYVVGGARPVQVFRPASFYYMNGRHERWSDYFGRERMSFAASKAAGRITLSVQQEGSPISYKLVLDQDRLLLRSVTGRSGETDIWFLTIDEYATKGAKSFPSRAAIELRNPKTGEVIRQERLLSTRVSFPESSEDVERAFDLTLPKSSLIADRELNRGTTTKGPLPAEEVIKNPGGSTWKPFAPRLPFVAVDASEDADAWLDSYWIWAAAVIGVLTVVSVAYYTRRVMGRRTVVTG